MLISLYVYLFKASILRASQKLHCRARTDIFFKKKTFPASSQNFPRSGAPKIRLFPARNLDFCKTGGERRDRERFFFATLPPCHEKSPLGILAHMKYSCSDLFESLLFFCRLKIKKSGKGGTKKSSFTISQPTITHMTCFLALILGEMKVHRKKNLQQLFAGCAGR